MIEPNVPAAVAAIRATIRKAEDEFSPHHYEAWTDDVIAYYLEEAYTQLLILAEALNLTRMCEQIRTSFEDAKKSGIAKTERGGPDDEIYLVVPGKLDKFISGFEATFGLMADQVVSKEVVEVLHATQKAITDRNCFPDLPKDEKDVHRRIEAVLKCIFPDLRHEPPISKPIKSFVPDTGLPSIRTLIEYKFIENDKQASRVADEILADTRGYTSSEWDKFIFIIYETHRLRTEHEWNDLLRQCGTARHTQAIVLYGEPPESRKRRKRTQFGSEPPRKLRKGKQDGSDWVANG